MRTQLLNFLPGTRQRRLRVLQLGLKGTAVLLEPDAQGLEAGLAVGPPGVGLAQRQLQFPDSLLSHVALRLQGCDLLLEIRDALAALSPVAHQLVAAVLQAGLQGQMRCLHLHQLAIQVTQLRVQFRFASRTRAFDIG